MNNEELEKLKQSLLNGQGMALDITWGPEVSYSSALVTKVWGGYTDMLRLENIVVKQLNITPGQKISNQKHQHRKETWIVLAGKGEACLQTEHSTLMLSLHPGTKFIVDRETWHQVKADDDSLLHILEIQEGESCVEDDIVRKEDVL